MKTTREASNALCVAPAKTRPAAKRSFQMR